MTDIEMKVNNPELYKNHRLATNLYRNERYNNDEEYRENLKKYQRDRYHRLHPNARFYDKN